MYVSARERLILDVLIDREEEMTVKDLADGIDVSVRTIHRDLKGIEQIIEAYDLSLVKKAGVGVQLVGSKNKRDELKMAMSHLSYNEYTPDERQTMLLCALLESVEPVKLVSLANDLRVTIATVSNDLTKIEKALEPFQLTIVRRRGYGVELEGSEAAKRRAMRKVIAEHVNEVDFLTLVKESIQKKSKDPTDSISERLLGLVEKKKLFVVEKVVKEINAGLPYPVADSAYIGLVVHLALAIERIERGGTIQMDHAYFNQLKAAPEFDIAREMTEKLQAVFQMDIPEAEVGYITMHLQGAKLRQDKEYVLEESSFQVALKAKGLIHFVESKLGVGLLENQSLFQGLVVHLKPAMYRINQKMGIANPLLERIQTDYGELFSVVREAAQHVFPSVDIPDEEIGYLVMHFGSALPGAKPPVPLHAYIICSTGIGTSKMLAARLQQEVPELASVQNISVFELNSMKADGNLVISTIPLPNFDHDHIVVSPMLTKEDLTKVHAYLRRHSAVPVRVTAPVSMPPVRSLSQIQETIQTIGRYTEALQSVLEQLSVRHSEKKEVDDVLKEACENLTSIRSEQTVVQAIQEREKLSGIGIPGTKLAFFHAKHPDVLKPSLTICKVKVPIVLAGMDGQPMESDTLLIMLAPDPYHAEGLEVLSTISSILIESDDSIELFQSGREEEVKEYTASKLEAFLYEKITELRSV